MHTHTITGVGCQQVEQGIGVSIPVGGANVYYDHLFQTTPSVNITVENEQDGDYALVSGITTSGFNVDVQHFYPYSLCQNAGGTVTAHGYNAGQEPWRAVDTKVDSSNMWQDSNSYTISWWHIDLGVASVVKHVRWAFGTTIAFTIYLMGSNTGDFNDGTAAILLSVHYPVYGGAFWSFLNYEVSNVNAYRYYGLTFVADTYATPFNLYEMELLGSTSVARTINWIASV